MAAGRGTRFGSRTDEMPKGFIPFNGQAMVVRSIENLIASGINRMVIGTGYHRECYERLARKYPQVETVFSPEFATTNSMETLWQCREAVGADSFLLLESDIVYEKRALDALLENPCGNIMLVADVTKFQDQYYVWADASGNLAGCSTDRNRYAGTPAGELVGIHKLSPEFYAAMCADYSSKRPELLKRGYEFEIEDISSRIPVKVMKVDGLQWYEIDDERDLAYAESHVSLR